MPCDTTCNHIRWMFDFSRFSSNSYLGNKLPPSSFCRLSSACWGVLTYIWLLLTVLSNCSGCHSTTHSSLQNALGSYLMPFCSFMYFSLLWTISRRGKPISSLTIKRNRSNSSLSDLWHLCKFPNICEDHKEDGIHHQKSRICDSSYSNYRQHFDGSKFCMYYGHTQSI